MLRSIVVVVLVAALGAPASAQTVVARGATAKPVLTAWADSWSAANPAPDEGTYERLSAGNQKIARAIFEAQNTDAPGHLSLDEIAAMKQRGPGGWGRVYEELQARGLVSDATLAQAVSRYHRTTK